MISFCFNIKDRSKVKITENHVDPFSGKQIKSKGMTLYLFPECISSIDKIFKDLDIESEIIITDWNSTDWPLAEWLPTKTDIPVKIFPIDRPGFDRGYGRNYGASKATGNFLFFLDTDMYLKDKGIISRGLEVLKKGKIYCPQCYYLLDLEGNGMWPPHAYGPMMIRKGMFNKTDGYPTGRSGEEFAFYKTLVNKFGQDSIVRKRESGLIHQWHPRKWEWRNRYTGIPRPKGRVVR